MGNSEGAFGVYFWVRDAVLSLASPWLPSFPMLGGEAERGEPLAPDGCATAQAAAPAGGIPTQHRGSHLPIGHRGDPFPRIRTGSGHRRLGRAPQRGSEASAQPEPGRSGVPGASATVAAALPGALELPGRPAAASAPLYSPLKIACLAPPCKAAGRSAARQSEAAVGARPRPRARSECRIGPQ